VRKPYRVEIAPPKRLADELYVLLRPKGQDSPPRVLVQIDRAAAPQIYPDYVDDFTYALTWIKDYGKGRVFYTQFGHNMAVYTVPCIAGSILDGLLYVSGQQVASPPASAPTRSKQVARGNVAPWGR
jgi:type 1 glutamine amidotransferase